jgi:hypothetical protein
LEWLGGEIKEEWFTGHVDRKISWIEESIEDPRGFLELIRKKFDLESPGVWS